MNVQHGVPHDFIFFCLTIHVIIRLLCRWHPALHSCWYWWSGWLENMHLYQWTHDSTSMGVKYEEHNSDQQASREWFFAFYCFQVFSKRSFDRFNWLNSLFWPPVGLGRGFMTRVYTFSHGLVPEFCWYTVEVTHLNQIGFSFFFFYIVLLGVENRQRPMEKSDACRTYINDVYIYNCCSCFSDFHHL